MPTNQPDTMTVKAYVENVQDYPHSDELRLIVTFRQEWPSKAITPTCKVAVTSKYADAVEKAWPSVVSFFHEIREPDRIELIKRCSP